MNDENTDEKILKLTIGTIYYRPADLEDMAEAVGNMAWRDGDTADSHAARYLDTAHKFGKKHFIRMELQGSVVHQDLDGLANVTLGMHLLGAYWQKEGRA